MRYNVDNKLAIHFYVLKPDNYVLMDIYDFEQTLGEIVEEAGSY